MYWIFNIVFCAALVACAVQDYRKREIPHTAVVCLLAITVIKFLFEIQNGNFAILFDLLILLGCIPLFKGYAKGTVGAGDIKMVVLGCLFMGITQALVSMIIALVAILIYGKAKKIKSVPMAVFFAPATIGVTILTNIFF